MSTKVDASRARTIAKGNITRYINKLTPLLASRGGDARRCSAEVAETWEKLMREADIFTRAHNKIVEVTIEAVVPGENDTETDAAFDAAMDSLEKYQEETANKLEDVKQKHREFQAYLKAEAKAREYQAAAAKYVSERQGILQLYRKVENGLAEKEIVLNVDVKDMSESLDRIFTSMTEILTEMREFAHEAGENLKTEQEDLVLEHGGLKTKIRMIRSFQEAHAVPGASGRSHGQAAATPAPIKLEKASAITFSGNHRDFATFLRDFRTIVIPERPPTEIGLRLRQAIPTKHAHLIQNFDLYEYEDMLKVLETEFGTTNKVILSIVGELEKLKLPSDDRAFVTMVEKIENLHRDAEAVNAVDQMANVTIISKIEERLPPNSSALWVKTVIKEQLELKSPRQKYDALKEFIKSEKDAAAYVVSKEALSGNKNQGNKSYVVTGQTFVTNTQAKFQVQCMVCEENGDRADHHPKNCEVWHNLSYDEKKELVTCVRHPWSKTHTTAECRVNVTCGNCGASHNTIFCNKAMAKTSVASTKTAAAGAEVLLKTLIVPTMSHRRMLSVMEDNASTDSYVTFEAVNDLKLRPVGEVVLEIEGINSTKTIDSKIYDVPIRDRKKNLHYVQCYGIKSISEVSHVPSPEVYREICERLQVAPSKVKRPASIDVLLSARSNYLMSDRVLAVSDGLKLYKGPLGLTISGNTDLLKSDQQKCYPTKATPVVSKVKKTLITKTLTDREILKFFREESIGAETNPKCGSCECGKCALGTQQMSLKEEREYKKFRQNMFLDEVGTEADPGPYWRTSYPWSVPKEDLIDNLPAVTAIMHSTMRKLDKDPNWREIYESQLKDLINNKFAREVTEAEFADWKEKGGLTYWIPHQMVINPASKSTPIRTVFNNSLVHQGWSFNSAVDLGPDMTNNLHGTLMRFREDVIGGQGDVRKMYYNIRVTREEEFMQMWMWHFKGESKPRMFCMTRLVMGSKPSANCSQMALRETAYIEDNDKKHPEAAEALVKNSYVDNTFFSVPDTDTAKKRIEVIEKVAARGGFYYKPWVISGQDVPDQLVVNGDVEDEKALGIHWSVRDDLFYVKVNVAGKKRNLKISLQNICDSPDLKLTLRDCLSIHAKAYDPLGIVLPTKQIGNLLFRKTLRGLNLNIKETSSGKKISPWDLEVIEFRDEWMQYFGMLEALKDIKFPRSIKPLNVMEDTKPCLITFSDGNEDAFGACAYALWTLADGTKEARLILSKAKLGPLLNKGETVKNELSGATFAVRIKTWIIQNAGIAYGDFIPFLDSMIVKFMIKKESYLFNTFVGLRVKEVDQKSDVESWRHIPSKENYVSDILTRGESPDKLGPGSDWQTGPKWLVEDPETWPVTSEEPDQEERKVIKSFEKVTKTFKAKTEVKSQSEHEDRHVFDQLIEDSSSLNKIINTAAFLLRLAGRGIKANEKKYLDFHKQPLKAKFENNPISSTEHEEAFLVLIHHEQKKLDLKKFSGFNIGEKEVTLSSGKSLKLVTVSSRVQNFPVTFGGSEASVYALPSHGLARRIAASFHQKYHKDVDTVVAHIRSQFWIPQLRRIVTNLDRKCRFCLILRQKICGQIMGKLPLERTNPSKAFEVVFLDIFGPLTMKDSVVKKGARVNKNVWGSLFACAGSRAVYIDVVEDSTSESVLHCVRRLMADKGAVRRIISDPGPNLVGAASALAEVREGWSQAELQEFGAKNGLEWDFIMAASQHQNGSAEVLIKLCKGIMKSLMKAIGTKVLFMNELFTCFKEVANLCNERPIGLKPNQSADLQYLSPNSLLLGRCSDRISAGPFQNKDYFEARPHDDRTRFLLVQKITEQFWQNWNKLYFPTLLRRQKWHVEERNLRIGDVCVVKENNVLRGNWRLCRVSNVFPDSDDVVRNVEIKVPPPSIDGTPEYKKNMVMGLLNRHVKNLIVIAPEGELGDEDGTENGRVCKADLQAIAAN